MQAQTELEFAQRKTLLAGLPVYENLGKAPPNNAGKTIPHDRVFLQIDGQLRELMRWACAVTEMLQGTLPMPEGYSYVELVKDLLALVLSITVSINSHR